MLEIAACNQYATNIVVMKTFSTHLIGKVLWMLKPAFLVRLSTTSLYRLFNNSLKPLRLSIQRHENMIVKIF